MYAYEDLMAALEARGLLDRAAEGLPATEEIAERRRAGRGLERPELALLLAYAKRALARDLLDSDFCDDPWLERDLREYFPDRVVERFGHLLAEHPLRRELIATVNANEVVNSLGPTFVSQLSAERGAEPADVVRAYRIARDGDRRRRALGRRRERSRAGSTGDVATELMVGVDRLVEATARWYLGHDDGSAARGADRGRGGAVRAAGRGRCPRSARTSGASSGATSPTGSSSTACRRTSRGRTRSRRS